MKDFSLTLHAGEGTTRTLLLEGRTDAQVRHWLGEQVDAAALDALKLDAPSPYEMPAHAITQGAPYDPKDAADSLAELAAWFGNAALSLGIIQKRMIERGLEASPVRCWPHHFDIATLTSLPTRSAGVTGYVGAGLSPGDEYYDEPYFYVSVYPRPDPALLPSLPALGHWHQQDFMAAVATARKIVACKHQQAQTDAFLQAAVDAAITVLKLPHPSHVQ